MLGFESRVTKYVVTTDAAQMITSSPPNPMPKIKTAPDRRGKLSTGPST